MLLYNILDILVSLSLVFNYDPKAVIFLIDYIVFLNIIIYWLMIILELMIS